MNQPFGQGPYCLAPHGPHARVARAVMLVSAAVPTQRGTMRIYACTQHTLNQLAFCPTVGLRCVAAWTVTR